MIPSQTGTRTHALLERIGREWPGCGVAVECGAWLGAGTAALARGLVAAGYDMPLYAFDRWQATRAEVRKAARAGVTISPGDDLLPAWRRNVSPIYGNLAAERVNLGRLTWSGNPIGILVVDAAKTEPHFSGMMGALVPALIPGAKVALLDYRYWRKWQGPWREKYQCQERWIAARAGEFEHVEDVPGECGAVFRFIGGRADD